MNSAPRIPSLDGWRAISIVIVMLSHFEFASAFPVDRAWWGRVFQGDLGVRIFFVISGFLITYLLLEEAGRAGRPSLKRFYARRVLRIFPVYYVFAAALLALTILHMYSDAWSTWLATLTFTRNIAGRGDSATVHLWSVAVEEQFYLVWPTTLTLLTLWRRRTATALAVLLVPIVLAPAFRWGFIQLHAGSALVQRLLGGFSVLLYADSLAIGCAGAFLYRRHRDRFRPLSMPYVAPVLTALLFAVAWVEWPPAYGPWALVPSIQALIIMAAIWATIERRTGVTYRLLNLAPAVWLGTLSYSIYVWQQLFLGQFAGPRLSGLAAWDWRVWWLTAVVVAVASYYVVERPILALRNRFR